MRKIIVTGSESRFGKSLQKINPKFLSTEIEVLKKMQPDVRILGADHEGKLYTGHELPIKCIFNTRDHGYSTSELRRRVFEAEKSKT